MQVTGFTCLDNAGDRCLDNAGDRYLDSTGNRCPDNASDTCLDNTGAGCLDDAGAMCLDGGVAGLGGDAAVVVTVTGHHDVALHAPRRAPAVQYKMMPVSSAWHSKHEHQTCRRVATNTPQVNAYG